MAAPTALAQFEAAENAIATILADPKAEAEWNGRRYRFQSLDVLRRASDYYRSLALQRGELDADANQQTIGVAQVFIQSDR